MMKIDLTEKPQRVTIIDGFPGFGFVSTIASEYLIDHLKTRPIGRIWAPGLAPMAIVHGKRVIPPIDILYDDKHHIVLLEAISGINGMEWDIAEALIFLYKKLNAKEIISIEGIGTDEETEEPNAYYFSTDDAKTKMMQNIGASPLKEGIILGVSGALLTKLSKEVKATFIFAETHSKMPDNRAAAKIVEILDKYLGLDVEYKPLLQRAGEMEEKIKELLTQAKEATEMQKQKGSDVTPYIG